jgi:hypothetical protein
MSAHSTGQVIDEAAAGPGGDKHALVALVVTESDAGSRLVAIEKEAWQTFPHRSLGGDATGTRIGEFLFAATPKRTSPNPAWASGSSAHCHDAVSGLPIDVAIASTGSGGKPSASAGHDPSRRLRPSAGESLQ